MKGITTLLILCYFSFAFADYDRGKEYSFKKISDAAKVFSFEHELKNGDKFRGNTTFLFEQYNYLKQMNDLFSLFLDSDDFIYWVVFHESDLNSTTTFLRTVRTVNQTEDGIAFRDDYFDYFLKFNDEALVIHPYPTDWDFEHICFKRDSDDSKLFRFEVNSLNNGRKYFGQTYSEDDGPLSQRIEISDAGKAVFRIDFTEKEFKSNDKFCRGISELIEIYKVLGAATISGIDPNALKSLVG